MSELNNFDLIVIGVLLFTSVRAYLHGFIKEFLHAGNYFISFILAKPISLLIKPYIAERTDSAMLIDYGSFTIAFMFIMLLLAIITNRFIPTLEKIITGHLNKFLGFALGFLKGYVYCAAFFTIYYLVYQNAEPVDERYGPAWMREAKSYNALKVSTNFLSPIILNNTDEKTKEALTSKDPEKIKEIAKEGKKVQKVINGKQNNTQTEEKKTRGVNTGKTNRYNRIKKKEQKEEDGYTKDDMRGLNKLFNTISDGLSQ